MLLADDVRNPGSPRSVNFCRLWESFARRGMGTDATDSADNGFNQVTAGYAVPEGCTPPPAPPSITIAVAAATATEAGPVNGTFTVSRGASQSSPLTVYVRTGGTAANGTDYSAIPASVTIPAGAASTTVDVVPVDDTLLESNETVTLTVSAGVGYVVGSPSTGTVTIVSDDVAPDFVLSALTVPLTGGAGQPVSVSDTTKNQGTGPSAPSVTSFFLSVDLTLDASDTPLGSRAVPELAIGASHTASSTFTLPSPLTPGAYRIIAKADGAGAITETNELNNLRSGLIKIGPDLAVTSLTVPSTAAAGATIVVSDTTANQGLDPAGGSQTRFYLSMNALFDGADTPLQTRTVGALAAGASSVGSTSLTIPAATPTGAFYVIAMADAAGSVAESTETNNTRYGLVRVGPDLQVTSITAPARGASGGVVAISDTTRNAGAGSAGSSNTAFYLSADYRLDAGDTLLAPQHAIGPLAGGASSSAVTNVTLPDVAPGTWYLIAQADNAGAVEETYENNNLRYRTIAIGPDLDVLTVVAPTTVTAGVAFNMTDTVKNIGMGTAAASVTRIYLSLDYLVDSSDTPLGERAVGALADNASSTGSIAVTVPVGTSGKVYLITVTDAAATVAESSESNNTLARLITVNAP
jgi:subtilase family serine protease